MVPEPQEISAHPVFKKMELKVIILCFGAPNAASVSVVGDFNIGMIPSTFFLAQTWRGFIPGITSKYCGNS